MSVSRVQIISEGTLTVVGKNSQGQDLTVEAEIRDLEVEVITDYDNIYSQYSIAPALQMPQSEEINFHLRVKDNWTVKVPQEREPVVRTARVLGWEDRVEAVQREPSIALIKAAAEKAGVDENTDFHLVYERNYARDTNQVYVEFKWTDE